MEAGFVSRLEREKVTRAYRRGEGERRQERVCVDAEVKGERERERVSQRERRDERSLQWLRCVDVLQMKRKKWMRLW